MGRSRLARPAPAPRPIGSLPGLRAHLDALLLQPLQRLGRPLGLRQAARGRRAAPEVVVARGVLRRRPALHLLTIVEASATAALGLSSLAPLFRLLLRPLSKVVQPSNTPP